MKTKQYQIQSPAPNNAPPPGINNKAHEGNQKTPATTHHQPHTPNAHTHYTCWGTHRHNYIYPHHTSYPGCRTQHTINLPITNSHHMPQTTHPPYTHTPPHNLPHNHQQTNTIHPTTTTFPPAPKQHAITTPRTSAHTDTK